MWNCLISVYLIIDYANSITINRNINSNRRNLLRIDVVIVKINQLGVLYKRKLYFQVMGAFRKRWDL